MLVLAGVAAGASIAGAFTPVRRPLPVASSSLTQSARRVVWRVTLRTPFSPSDLAGAGRSLCLLIERPADGSVAGELCVAGPRAPGRSPRLVYRRITRAGPGAAALVPATITRHGARDLTATFLPAAFGNSYRSVRWQVLSAVTSGRCAAAAPHRAGCSVAFPAQPALATLHTPQLVGCAPSGPAFVDNGSDARREIALTFDDGPWYQTPQFLTLLEHYKVPATFFEIGEHIATYGQGGAIERRMLADGDMIGDHTWDHVVVAGAGSFAAAEISRTAAAIRQATHGFTPCLFRAPDGSVSTALIAEARAMGFTTIQWDIDPRDWARPGTAAIAANVIANAHPGAIVIQHDGGGDRSQTLAALPDEIQTLRSRGYRLVTVTQLLGQHLIYR
jgi:peptidoglycan/xylan/chitin deacetylase (PgdA/CDA1 family)